MDNKHVLFECGRFGHGKNKKLFIQPIDYDTTVYEIRRSYRLQPGRNELLEFYTIFLDDLNPAWCDTTRKYRMCLFRFCVLFWCHVVLSCVVDVNQ